MHHKKTTSILLDFLSRFADLEVSIFLLQNDHPIVVLSLYHFIMIQGAAAVEGNVSDRQGLLSL